MRNFLKALLTSLARTVEFVWESGKLVARFITGSTPVEPHVSAAQEAAEAEMHLHEAMDRAYEADQAKWHAESAVGQKWPAAFAIKEYLWTVEETWSFDGPGIDHLPPNVQAWVRGLTREQAILVRDETHLSDLEAHVTGTRTCRSPPKLSSTADLIAKAEAAAAEREATMAILEDLIDDAEPRGRRAA